MRAVGRSRTRLARSQPPALMRARARFAMPTFLSSLAVHSDVSDGRYAPPRFFFVSFFGSCLVAGISRARRWEKNATLPHAAAPSAALPTAT